MGYVYCLSLQKSGDWPHHPAKSCMQLLPVSSWHTHVPGPGGGKGFPIPFWFLHAANFPLMVS